MKRFKIRHCRDSAVVPEARWDVWMIDTHDPHADPLFLGWGTWASCMFVVRALIWENQRQPAFTFAGFQSPAPF